MGLYRRAIHTQQLNKQKDTYQSMLCHGRDRFKCHIGEYELTGVCVCVGGGWIFKLKSARIETDQLCGASISQRVVRRI